MQLIPPPTLPLRGVIGYRTAFLAPTAPKKLDFAVSQRWCRAAGPSRYYFQWPASGVCLGHCRAPAPARPGQSCASICQGWRSLLSICPLSTPTLQGAASFLCQAAQPEPNPAPPPPTPYFPGHRRNRRLFCFPSSPVISWSNLIFFSLLHPRTNSFANKGLTASGIFFVALLLLPFVDTRYHRPLLSLLFVFFILESSIPSAACVCLSLVEKHFSLLAAHPSPLLSYPSNILSKSS